MRGLDDRVGLHLDQRGGEGRAVPHDRARALGVGLPYALTVSIFGGTADSVALWFKSIGREEWFYYYLTFMIGISLVVYLFMRDTKADSAMHRHV